MKVSVIIPVYNVEKYLRECLDSVVNQTLKDIEIICVNDGSTDGSLKILEEYAQKDERIKIFTQENSGAAVARNLGIEKAQGEYLSILDSDDYFESEMLELLYERAERDDLDCTICRCRILNDKNNEIKNADFSLRKDLLPDKEVFNYKDIKNHIFGFCIGWSWDKLYKRDFVIKNNLKFQNLRSTNDMLFVFMSLVLSERIGTIDDILITHRENRPQQLSETREKDPMCFIKAVFELKKQLEKQKIFKEVKQSFDNWVLEFSFWQLDTLKEPQAGLLQNKLSKNVFKKLSFYKMSAEYFYHNENYNRFKQWEKLSVLEKIFSSKNKDEHKIITVLGIKIKIKKFKYNQFWFLLKYRLVKLLNKTTDFNTFIITKFNVDIRYDYYRLKEIGENPNINLDTAYISKRFELFEKYYLPSLKSQTDKKFKAIVLFHSKTPEFFKEKIKEYQKEYGDFFVPVFCDTYDTVKIKSVVDSYMTDTKWVLTIRMDNDDAIAYNFIEQMRTCFAPINSMFISFANGAILEENKKQAYKDYNISGHFLGFVENIRKKFDTAFCYHHWFAKDKFKNFLLIKNPQEAMWLEVVHDVNVSNDSRGVKESCPELLNRFEIKMRNNK